jgi:peptidyl-prolyl cis-trans isomerase C
LSTPVSFVTDTAMRLLAWMTVLATSLTACPVKKPVSDDLSVVATVNGEPISKESFEIELAREAQSMEGVGPRTPEQITPYKNALLSTLVDHAVLLQAARSEKVTVSSDDVERRLLALAGEYPAGSFDDVLSQGHTSKQALERNVRERLTIERLLVEKVYARLAVTEEAIRREYDADLDTYNVPEQVHAAQIVVKGLDEAKRIAQLLREGKKFGDLARLYSQSQDAKVGGDLGTFARGQMPDAFDQVVFRLAPNQVSEVVATDYGFHLFKTLEKFPPRKRELGEVRALIEARMLRTLKVEAEADYVTKLKSSATIHINQAVVDAVSGRPRVGNSKEP